MKKLIGIFLVIVLLCPVICAGAEGFVFRENITWGMNSSEIKKFEGEPDTESHHKGVRSLKYRDAETGGCRMDLWYGLSDDFTGNWLFEAFYYQKWEDRAEAEKAKEKLLEAYRAQYGEPVSDENGYSTVAGVIWAERKLHSKPVSNIDFQATARNFTSWLPEDAVIMIGERYNSDKKAYELYVYYLNPEIVELHFHEERDMF